MSPEDIVRLLAHVAACWDSIAQYATDEQVRATARLEVDRFIRWRERYPVEFAQLDEELYATSA